MRKLIVPLDGSSEAERVLPLALAIAARSDAELRLVTVHHLSHSTLGLHDMGLAFAAIDREIRNDERMYLEAKVRDISASHGIAPIPVLLDGNPAEELVRYAREERADLVVMATHGRGGVCRLWLGSVADQVVRQADQPVLLIRPDGLDQPVSFQRILVPLDGSRRAEKALPGAWELLAPETGVLHLLNVVTLPFMFAPPARPGLDPESENVQRRKLFAYRYLRRIAAGPRAEGAAVAVHVAEGLDPAREILRYCADERIDLVAIATHGRAGPARWALGSVEDKIVRAGMAPVLVCRAPEAGDAMSHAYRAAMLEQDPSERAEPAVT